MFEPMPETCRQTRARLRRLKAKLIPDLKPRTRKLHRLQPKPIATQRVRGKLARNRPIGQPASVASIPPAFRQHSLPAPISGIVRPQMRKNADFSLLICRQRTSSGPETARPKRRLKDTCIFWTDMEKAKWNKPIGYSRICPNLPAPSNSLTFT